MTDTSLLHSPTSVSTFGLPVAYKPSRPGPPSEMLKASLSEYRIRTQPPDYRIAKRREQPTTQPISRGVYFSKAPENSVIECYYFRGHGSDFAAPAVPAETYLRGINSSFREVTAMLFFAAANAQDVGEASRPLIRPEKLAWEGKGCYSHTWIAHEKKDISPMIRTLQSIHRGSILTELIERASRLVGLKKGWNSYSAPAPSSATIGNAKTLLTLAFAAGIIPERIEPSAMGGAGVTFTAGGREITVEFYNAGNAHALFSDNRTETLDTAPVALSVEGYNRLLQQVRRYLYSHDTPVQAPRSEFPGR
jgi:hypothetical protein